MFVDQLKIELSAGEKADEISEDYFVSKVLENEDSRFEQLDPNSRIEEKWEKLLEEERERVSEKVENVDSALSEITWKMLLSSSLAKNRYRREKKAGAGWLYRDGETDALIFYMQKGRDRREKERGYTNLLVVSDSKENNQEVLDYIEEQISDLERLVDDFIVFDGVKNGSDLLMEMLNSNTEEWKRKESQNDFEEEIQDYIGNRINVMLPNVEAQFESGENSEYDLVALPLGMFGPQYVIEAKDFEEVQEQIEADEEQTGLNTTLKNKLITQPKDQADMLEMNLIMVVNELSGQRYKNLRKHAEQRNVVLLNDDNYEERIEEILVKKSLESLTSSSPGGVVEYV